MDTAFLLDENGRANFFQLLMQSIPYTYICLWSYLPQPSSCLIYLDGFFYEEHNQQPSSSSGSQARTLFEEYRQSVFVIENETVPGLAYKNIRPYLELQEVHLQRLASNKAQRQFYQEARIKTAIFMGCKSGEIEIGLSKVPAEIDIKKELRSLFPDEFSRQFSPLRLPDQNQPSSPSSLSMDSPEYSSLLFNIPSTTHIPETHREANPTLQQIPPPTSPHQAAMQAFARLRNIPFPNPESEAAAMTRAILAVLTSPSSSSHQPHPNLPYGHQVVSKPSAFKRHASALRPITTTQVRANLGRQSLLKRSIAFFRSLNYLRVNVRMQASRPTSTQLHHMISERKRREKINESFQSLRSLLPPGTKKDKASLLTTTREYLSSLKAQVEELNKRNQLLEARSLPAKEAKYEEETSFSNERLNVRISQVSESTSEENIVDLRVTIRGECPMVDMLIRILEFLKQVENVSLQSMETNTRIIESSSMNHIILRLRIEGSEWDEATFQEAVKRVVANLAP